MRNFGVPFGDVSKYGCAVTFLFIKLYSLLQNTTT